MAGFQKAGVAEAIFIDAELCPFKQTKLLYVLQGISLKENLLL